MATVKVARRPIAIGPYALEAGDVLTDEAEALLPAGRLKTLVYSGVLAERPVVSDPMMDLAEALARIETLEEKVAALEARRGPGRPRKVEE